MVKFLRNKTMVAAGFWIPVAGWGILGAAICLWSYDYAIRQMAKRKVKEEKK